MPTRLEIELKDEVEQLRRDNAALLTCVQTAIKYGRIENPTAALQFLVRKLRSTDALDS